MEKLLVTKEVAEMLNVSPRMVDILRQKYALPFIAVGGSVRFDRADIERWLEKQKNKGKNDKD